MEKIPRKDLHPKETRIILRDFNDLFPLAFGELQHAKDLARRTKGRGGRGGGAWIKLDLTEIHERTEVWSQWEGCFLHFHAEIFGWWLKNLFFIFSTLNVWEILVPIWLALTFFRWVCSTTNSKKAGHFYEFPSLKGVIFRSYTPVNWHSNESNIPSFVDVFRIYWKTWISLSYVSLPEGI